MGFFGFVLYFYVSNKKKKLALQTFVSIQSKKMCFKIAQNQIKP